MMEELFQLRSNVYLAASEYYQAHGEFLNDAGGSEYVSKKCVEAGNNYKDALQTLLAHLTALVPREPYEEAINSAEALLLSLDCKLKMLQPPKQSRKEQPQAGTPQPIRCKQVSVQRESLQGS
jgi:hypothetical protein